MAIPWAEFVQLEKDGKLMFEKDLFELSKLLDRPAPEFKGAQVNINGNGNLSWLIESSVRGNLKSPHSETMITTIIDVSWDAGLGQAMERLLARLCEVHKEELANSRFQFYGRRDSMGNPLPTRQHHDFGQHLEDVEHLLHQTQDKLCHARMDCDLKDMQIVDITGELFDAQEELQIVQNQLQASQNKLKISKNSRNRLNKIKKRIQLSNDYLREQLGDLQEKMEQKESQVKELVGKVQDLRKEVEEFLSYGDSLMEDVGMEPKVPSQ